MLITILTLFPEVFQSTFSSSIIGRAQKKSLANIRYINIRDFASDKHGSVDDKPYGGGVGMVMRVDVVAKAIATARYNAPQPPLKVRGGEGGVIEKVILLDPKGKQFNQSKARNYSKLDHLILVCGHYEGIDARISKFVDDTISIGKYVLTGGEIPAMVITDAVTRLIPGVLKPEATTDESFSLLTSHFSPPKLEYPQYTRPENFRGYHVPKVLLSGNHRKIKEWQEQTH